MYCSNSKIVSLLSKTKTICDKPLLNGEKLKTFLLRLGTREEYAVSLPVSNIILGILAIAVRQEQAIGGI
jgi:hypothetical protein